MEELTITVNIADRPYRLKIRRDEEEVIRRAVKEIDLHIRDYSDSFAFQDKQDLLAMVLLHFSSTSLKLEQELSTREDQILSGLKKLDHYMAEHLA
jgi:cell division protein ZapA